MNWITKRILAVMLAGCMIALSSERANAGLAPAMLPEDATVRAHDLQTVQQFLERKEVGEHLSRFSLTPTEISSQINNLSDEDLHRAATRIEKENPGGDSVAGILVVVLLVLLVIYLVKRV